MGRDQKQGNESKGAVKSLVEKAQRGDRQAWNELFTRYQPRLEFLVHLRLGKALRRKIDIKDVIQETFLTAYKSIRSFKPESDHTFRRWLFKISENEILKQRRHLTAQKRDFNLEVSLNQAAGHDTEGRRGLASALADSGISPVTLALQNERFERLMAAIENLGEDRREVVILSRIKELPMAEIAQIMNRNKEACSMLLLRAMRELGAAMKGTGLRR